jgi:hypothetical protein
MPRARPVEFHVVAILILSENTLDATALSRGGSRFWLHSNKRETSTGQARGIFRRRRVGFSEQA